MNSSGHNWYFDKCCGNDDITLHRHAHTHWYIPGRAVINFIIIIIIIRYYYIRTNGFNTRLVQRKRLIHIDRDASINNVYYLYLIISISQLLHHMRCSQTTPSLPPPNNPFRYCMMDSIIISCNAHCFSTRCSGGLR